MKYSNKLLVIIAAGLLCSCGGKKSPVEKRIKLETNPVPETLVKESESFTKFKKSLENKYKKIVEFESGFKTLRTIPHPDEATDFFSLFSNATTRAEFDIKGTLKINRKNRRFELNSGKKRLLLYNNYFWNTAGGVSSRSRWRRLENIRCTPSIVFLVFQPDFKNWCRFIVSDYLDINDDLNLSLDESFDAKTGDETALLSYTAGDLKMKISVNIVTLLINSVTLTEKNKTLLDEKYTDIEYNNKITINPPAPENIENRVRQNWSENQEKIPFKSSLPPAPRIKKIPDKKIYFLSSGLKSLRKICSDNKTMIFLGTIRFTKIRDLLIDVSENISDFKKHFKPVFYLFEPEITPVQAFIKKYQIKGIDIAVDTGGFKSPELYRLGLNSLPAVWIVSKRKTIIHRFNPPGRLNDFLIDLYDKKITGNFFLVNEYRKVPDPAVEVENINGQFFDHNLLTGRAGIENNFVNHPLDITACSQSAYDYYDNGVTNSFKFYFKYILLVNPMYDWIDLIRGYYKFMNGDINEAISYYRECLEKNSQNSWANLNISIAGLSGRFSQPGFSKYISNEERISYLRTVLKKFPTSPMLLENLSGLYRQNRMYGKSEEIDRRLIRSYPSYWGYTNLGRRFYYTYMYDKAEKFFVLALKCYPSPYPYNQLKNIYERMNDDEKAKKIQREKLEYFPPGKGRGIDIEGEATTDTKASKEMLVRIERELKTNPEKGELYLAAGYLYEQFGDRKRAKENYRNALKYIKDAEQIKFLKQKLRQK